MRRYAPADPLFFLLHANADRAWTHWQAKYNAFDNKGSDIKSYHAMGSYPGVNNAEYLDGSYALDEMWPWRTSTPNRWPQGIMFIMPVGTNGNIDTIPPTPASQIDSLNILGDSVPSGACYDDLTFFDVITN